MKDAQFFDEFVVLGRLINRRFASHSARCNVRETTNDKLTGACSSERLQLGKSKSPAHASDLKTRPSYFCIRSSISTAFLRVKYSFQTSAPSLWSAFNIFSKDTTKPFTLVQRCKDRWSTQLVDSNENDWRLCEIRLVKSRRFVCSGLPWTTSDHGYNHTIS